MARLTPEQERLIAKRMLQLTHAEIGRYCGIMTNCGATKPTRENVIQSSLEYGHSYDIKRPAIEKALDEWKDKYGFSRFRQL